MSSIATTAAMCLVLAFTSQAVTPAASGPPARQEATKDAPTPSEVAASLMVEAETDEQRDVTLRTRVYEEAGRVMAAMSVIQRARLDLPGIVITLRRLPGEPAGASYSIAIRHTPLGETPMATIGGVCESMDACAEQIGADLGVLLPRLRRYVTSDKSTATMAPSAAAVPLPVVAPPALAGVTANAPNIVVPRSRQRLTRLSKAGIGVLAAGAAGLVVGIGLAANPPRLNPKDWAYLITTRPVGYATLGVSLAVMTAGTVMLIVGRRRTPRVVPIAQTFGGRSLGLGLSGHF